MQAPVQEAKTPVVSGHTDRIGCPKGFVGKRLALALLLVLAPLSAGIGAYWWNRPKAGETVWHGRTARQWEAEIDRWEPSIHWWGAMLPPNIVWVEKIEPTIRERLGDWLDGRSGRGMTFGSLKLILDGCPRLPAGLKAEPEAIPVLLELLESRRPLVRCAAVQTLGMIGEPASAATPALIAALVDPETVVRENAEWALRRVDPKAAKKMAATLSQAEGPE